MEAVHVNRMPSPAEKRPKTWHTTSDLRLPRSRRLELDETIATSPEDAGELMHVRL
jgi:hypothetical protein